MFSPVNAVTPIPLPQVTELVRNIEEADGYNQELVQEARQSQEVLENKEYVVQDCRRFIESLTDQVDARSEEVARLQEEKEARLQEEKEARLQEAIKMKEQLMGANGQQQQEELQKKINEQEEEILRLQVGKDAQMQEVARLQEQLLNSSALQGRDEEIAGLQAELALLQGQEERVQELEQKLGQEQARVTELEHVEQVEGSERIQELEEQLQQEHQKVQELQDKLNQEQEAAARVQGKIQEHNLVIQELKTDLNRRNEQVLGFVHKLKEIKDCIKEQGGSKARDFLTPDLLEQVDFDSESPESLDWDYEGIIGQSTEFLARLARTPGPQEQDHEVQELKQEVQELRSNLEEKEQEQQEMSQYLNTKLGEIKEVSEELIKVKEAKVVWEKKLQNSLTAIQGFVSENRRLQEQVVIAEERQQELVQEVGRLQEHLHVRDEEQAVVVGGQGTKEAVARARELFSDRLVLYRGRYCFLSV